MTLPDNWQEKLKAFFPQDEVYVRIGARTKAKDKGIGLWYINARSVMNRLDAAVGPENWATDFRDLGGGTYCGVGICTDNGWVWKWDTGLVSTKGTNVTEDTEEMAEKGTASDALKRAAVQWGIGRYLYEIPNTWLPLIDDGRKFERPPVMLPKFLPKPTGAKPAATQIVTQPADKAPVSVETTTTVPPATEPPPVVVKGPLMQVDTSLMVSMPEDSDKVWKIIDGLPPNKQAQAQAMRAGGKTDTEIWSKVMSKK